MTSTVISPDTNLLKVRNSARILMDAFRLAAKNWWTLIRLLWPYLVLASGFTTAGLIASISTLYLPSETYTMPMAVAVCVIVLVAMLCRWMYIGRLIVMVRNYAREGFFPRLTLKHQSATFIPALSAAARLWPLWLLWIALNALTVIVPKSLWGVGPLLLLGIPLVAYAVVATALHQKPSYRGAFAELKQGFQSYGTLLAVLVGLSVVIVVALFIVWMPSIVLATNVVVYRNSLLQGDEVMLPSAFMWYIAITYFVSLMLHLYLHVLVPLALLFLAGSKKEEEKESLELND